jgi:hypothetical protein
MKTNKDEGSGHPNFSTQANFSERCVASCRKLLAQIENVKAQVMAEFRDRLDGHQRLLELAINEAEALAWQTEFPQLLFPTLALEKARAVAGWHFRQQSLRGTPAPALMAA